MFTGIVDGVGTIKLVEAQATSCRLLVETHYDHLKLGESICLNGACLTVASLDPAQCSAGYFDLSYETMQKTTFAHVRKEDRVHIERAMLCTDRFGGHIVTGHVDDTVRLLERAQVGDMQRLRFEIPTQFMRHLVPKGSIALHGVSLTVNEVFDSTFSVMIVPFTAQHTLLGEMMTGARLNLETDILAKYVARNLEFMPK